MQMITKIGLGVGAALAVGTGIAISVAVAGADHDANEASGTTGPGGRGTSDGGTVDLQGDPNSGSLLDGPKPDPTVLTPVEIKNPEYLRAETKHATHSLRETSVTDFATNLFGRYDHNENGSIEISRDVRGLQQDERVTGHEDAYYSLLNTFQAADADKNEQITLAELTNYIDRFDNEGGDHAMWDGSFRDGKLGIMELKMFGMAEIREHSDQSMEYDLIGVQQQVVDGAGVLHENKAFSRDLPEYREWPDMTID